MRLQTIGNIILFAIIYIVVFGILAKVGVFAAVVGAVTATQWFKKNFK
ncbi:hypothetical protein [Desulfocastanea catecholica]